MTTQIAFNFHPKTVLIWRQPRTKKETISELFEALQTTYPDSVKPQALQAILQREAEMSMFLNEGLAIPHAAIVGLDRVYWGIGIPKYGITDLDAGTEIHGVLLALYPPDQSTAYLRGLARLAAMFRNRVSLEQLAAVECADDVVRWLVGNDKAGT